MTALRVRWKRLGGIVAVQSAITLAWVVYALYLPDLLVQLGLSPGLAGTLLVVENLLAAAIEPIFGRLSDRAQQAIGTRFPWIALGVLLASGSFIALPAIAAIGDAASVGRWLFPALAVGWASAMAVFRSPTVALLGRAAPPLDWPVAASGLTFVQQAIGAFRFSAHRWIVGFGPMVAFAVGSFALLGSAAILRRVLPPAAPQPPTGPPPDFSVRTGARLAALAIAVAWGLRFLFASLTQQIAALGGADRVDGSLLIFGLWLAIAALPAGWAARRFGNDRLLAASAIAAAVLLGLSAQATAMEPWVAIAGALGLSFSAVLNGTVPWVLARVPEARSGAAIGLYFGAFGGAMVLFDTGWSRASDLGWQAGLGAIALVAAAIVAATGDRPRSAA